MIRGQIIYLFCHPTFLSKIRVSVEKNETNFSNRFSCPPDKILVPCLVQYIKIKFCTLLQNIARNHVRKKRSKKMKEEQKMKPVTSCNISLVRPHPHNFY